VKKWLLLVFGLLVVFGVFFVVGTGYFQKTQIPVDIYSNVDGLVVLANDGTGFRRLAGMVGKAGMIVDNGQGLKETIHPRFVRLIFMPQIPNENLKIDEGGLWFSSRFVGVDGGVNLYVYASDVVLKRSDINKQLTGYVADLMISNLSARAGGVEKVVSNYLWKDIKRNEKYYIKVTGYEKAN
jgi:hypothetical protein